ncbi:MAG: tripartite tricarboxylate transporter permease [Bacillota bacterium]
MAIVLIISITLAWSSWDALALIMGTYCGSRFGGPISAVLLNIPGRPAVCATALDGYPLAQKGEADAISLARIGSFLGGLIGIGFLARR